MSLPQMLILPLAAMPVSELSLANFSGSSSLLNLLSFIWFKFI
ncbi:hypothetical protein [Campylobacter concisus]|jgi:hypothetical protein|nr:hypothetical protein [Campylobacter concisus]